MLFSRFFPKSETATRHITTRVLSDLETVLFFFASDILKCWMLEAPTGH